MRTAFFQFLLQQAEVDPNLYLIVGDVGFSLIEPFQQKFPTRYINAGVAEQNMIGVAAGLAMSGKNVYVYSIIPFTTLRCFEQIRDDLCYQQLPVKIVGVGAGFSYGAMGVTHHAIEDVAVLRSLPEMTVVAPGSVLETRALLPQIHTLNAPAYVRFGNNEETITYPANTTITLGKAVEIIPHPDRYIVATGNALDLAYKVCKTVGDIGLVSMPTIKPLDTTFFTSRKLSAVFTIEEHSVIGGLGDAVARTLCEEVEHKVIFKAFGVQDFYFHEAGPRAYLLEKAGLSSDVISAVIKEKINAFTPPLSIPSYQQPGTY